MTRRIDYKLDSTFDFSQSNGAYETIAGGDVLIQNVLLLVAQETVPLVGETVTATNLSRYKQRSERVVRGEPYIDSFSINYFDIDESTLFVKATVNGIAIDEEVTLV